MRDNGAGVSFRVSVPVLLLSLLATEVDAPAEAKSLAVLTDGRFDEWGRRKARIVDARGDGAAGGVDLGRLWLADDGEALFLRLELGRETLLQNPPGAPIGNRLRLYLDVDGRKTTGTRLGVLGVDLELRFGEREVVAYDAAGAATLERAGTGIYQAMPTYSAEAFEIRVELPPREATEALAGKRRKVRLVLREETGDGDRLPDRGVLTYRLGRKSPPAPEPIELERPGNRALRILSINVEDARIGVVPKIYRRFFRLLRPDVICLQSLRDWSTRRTLDFIAGTLPGNWSIARVDDVHTISLLPIAAAEAIDGNLVTHIELPARLGERDLVLFNVHPPCCDNDAGRDAEADRLAATWRDLLDGSGPFAIDPGDAMAIVGDFNLVGFRRQLEALRDGAFIDPARGPDFAPGRAEGSLREAPLRHTHRRLIHTWRRAASAFAPGKLDFVLYTGDALEHLGSFVPDTEGMPEDFLEAAGLEATDSLEMSDHLPLVVDFELRDR